MGKTKPGTVKETGAPPYAYLTSEEPANRGIIIQVQKRQERGEGGQVKGRFKIVTVGLGKYKRELSQYRTHHQNQLVTAEEVIGEIAPPLVKAGKLREPKLCIFNCDLLRLYEPDALFDLKTHDEELANLSPTEREAVIKARIGQGPYRKNLIDLWKGCAVTGCNNEAVLRASHAKPWRDCSNQERLDRFNGLLLTPNLDVLFDQHLITFEEDLSIRISRRLSEEDQKRLGIGPELRLRKLCPQSKEYLSYHREKFYLKECP